MYVCMYACMRVDLYVDLYVALCEHFGTFLRASDASTLARFAGIKGEGLVDPDERTARVKGNERPLPPPLLWHPALYLTDVV